MEKIVLVLNVGGFLKAKSRNSIMAAADRWGAKYVEVTQRLLDRAHHVWWEKLAAGLQFAETDCQVVQLDADMLIRFDCPSPFDLVSRGSIGLVRSNPRMAGQVAYNDECCQAALEVCDVTPIDPAVEYCNAGFEVYSMPEHRSILEWCLAQAPRFGYTQGLCAEQTLFNLRVRHERVPVVYLPDLFNTCFIDRRHLTSVKGGMTSYVYHFVAWTKKHLPNIDWRKADTIYSQAELLLSLAPPGSFRFLNIGCETGGVAARILSSRPDCQAVLMDPMGQDTNGEPARSLTARSSAIFAATQFAAGRVQYAMPLGPQVGFNRGLAACTDIEGDFELVYVSRDVHAWRIVKKIDAVWSRIKPGGYLVGRLNPQGQLQQTIRHLPVKKIGKCWVAQRPG